MASRMGGRITIECSRLPGEPSSKALFATQETNSRRERSPIEVAEGQKLGRIDVVVDGKCVLPIGDVIESAAQRPGEAEGVKSLSRWKFKLK